MAARHAGGLIVFRRAFDAAIQKGFLPSCRRVKMRMEA